MVPIGVTSRSGRSRRHGAFFAPVYAATQLLPTRIASTIMATFSVAIAVAAWVILRERGRIRSTREGRRNVRFLVDLWV